MTKIERQIVFNKYEGKCAYCGCELAKGWHVDHKEPIRRNNDGTCINPHNECMDNYMPSCASCNVQKNSYTLEEFRKNIKHFVYSLNNYITQYKFAKKYGLVKETENEVVFYFEEHHKLGK